MKNSMLLQVMACSQAPQFENNAAISIHVMQSYYVTYSMS